MSNQKKMNQQITAASSIPADSLNVKIGVLTRREVEARILKPMLDAMGEAFGHEKALKVMQNTIVSIAEDQGAELAIRMGGNSLKHFAESLKFWKMDNALEIDVLEQTERAFAFNVTRCRYAELYKELGIRGLGKSLSCARDFALVKGFNPAVSLSRTQTIMDGAPYCDFRYRKD